MPRQLRLRPMRRNSTDCDLCVLGAGGGGLVAAVRYAQLTGKRVLVLEKAKKVGGSTTLAHNWFTGYMDWHRQAGLPDNTDKLLSYCLREAQGKLPHSLVEKILRNTGKFFQWLVDWDETEARACFAIGRGPMGAIGIDYPDRRFENLRCHDPAIGPGWAGTYLIRKMMQICQKLGVEVRTEHEAVQLPSDHTGAVTGVLAKNPGGELEVRAKAVILATGGFSGNDEKLKKREPGFFDGGIPVHRFSPVSCSGDGMDLAEQVGGWVNMEKTKLNKFGPVHHPYTATGCGMAGFGAAMVDFRGNLQEMPIGPMGDTSFLDGIPEHAIWYIVPGDVVEQKLRDSVDHPREGNQGMTYEDYRAELDFELRSQGPAYCADTLEGLAEQLHMDPKVFCASIEAYNEGLKSPKTPKNPFEMPEGEAGESLLRRGRARSAAAPSRVPHCPGALLCLPGPAVLRGRLRRRHDRRKYGGDPARRHRDSRALRRGRRGIHLVHPGGTGPPDGTDLGGELRLPGRGIRRGKGINNSGALQNK